MEKPMGVKAKEQPSDSAVDPAMLSICSGEEHTENTVFFFHNTKEIFTFFRNTVFFFFGEIRSCSTLAVKIFYLKALICRHIRGKYKEILALIIYFENSKVIPKTSTI